MTEKRRGRILVVEDEIDIRELIELQLLRDGHFVETASDGEDALRRLLAAESPESLPELLVVDWMLPGLSGLEITQAVRKSPLLQKIPVLMVTARAEAADVVLGLEAGADDYVTKPFDIPVLLARVRALLRRAQQVATESTGESDLLELGALRVDRASHLVSCEGERVELTPSEFKLLVVLIEHRGKVLTRDQLIHAVQGQGVNVVDRAIDTHVFGLRKKLGACADWVETVRGVGYRVRPEENRAAARGATAPASAVSSPKKPEGR